MREKLPVNVIPISEKLLLKQAERVVTSKVIKEVAHGRICGCAKCLHASREMIKWWLAPDMVVENKEELDDLALTIFDRYKKEHR